MPKHLLGFTLIEVLIALAIISIAMTAIIKAATQNIHNLTYLQDKMIATWVGQQALNEVRVRILMPDSNNNILQQSTTMLGKEWSWKIKQTETANPRIKKVSVTVYPKGKEEDESPLANLESYIYYATST